MKKLKRILVLVNAPETVDIELQRAVQIAEAADAQLHCLHVLHASLFGLDAAWKPEEEAALKRQIAERVQGFAEKVECIVHIGKDELPESIAFTAEEIDADLLVLGVHNRSAADETLAAEIAQSLSLPVLIVKNRVLGAYAKVVAVTDLSEAADTAVRFVTHALEPASIALLHFYETAADLQSGQADSGMERVEHLLSEPPFCETFLKRIREAKYDLAVVGTEPVGLGGWYLGLEVENLLDRSAADLLLYFGPD